MANIQKTKELRSNDLEKKLFNEYFQRWDITRLPARYTYKGQAFRVETNALFREKRKRRKEFLEGNNRFNAWIYPWNKKHIIEWQELRFYRFEDLLEDTEYGRKIRGEWTQREMALFYKSKGELAKIRTNAAWDFAAKLNYQAKQYSERNPILNKA